MLSHTISGKDEESLADERRSEQRKQKRTVRYPRNKTSSKFEVLDVSSRLMPTDTFAAMYKLQSGLSSAR